MYGVSAQSYYFQITGGYHVLVDSSPAVAHFAELVPWVSKDTVFAVAVAGI